MTNSTRFHSPVGTIEVISCDWMHEGWALWVARNATDPDSTLYDPYGAVLHSKYVPDFQSAMKSYINYVAMNRARMRFRTYDILCLSKDDYEALFKEA